MDDGQQEATNCATRMPYSTTRQATLASMTSKRRSMAYLAAQQMDNNHGNYRLRRSLAAVIMSIVTLAGLIEVEAAPYIPEVVYPSMSRTTRAPLRNISRNHEAGYPARGEGTSSAPYFRGTSSKRRVVAAAQRQYSVNFPVLPISSETTSGESRIILSPIDGEKVYTMDKYVVVSSEVVDSNRPPPAFKIKRVNLPSGFVRDVVKGQSSVKEVHWEQMKRTTMSELAVNASEVNALITTTISSTTRAQAVNIKIPKFTLPKNSFPKTGANDVQVISHDTSTSRRATLSGEVRFPARNWQLPPSLYSARRQNVDKDRNASPLRPRYFTGQATFDEALDTYLRSQTPRPPYSANLQPSLLPPNHPVGLYRQPALPPAALDRTKFQSREFIAEERKKFRAVFAKHNEREQPIPLHAIKEDHTDDTDMDLLLPDALAQQASPQRGITLAASGAAHAQVAAQADYTVQKYQSRLDPNQKLDSCCRKQGVSPHCQQVCNFDNFTDRSLVTAILTNQCPGPELGRAFDCATAKVDHSDCCLRANVHLHNGGQCMPWCRTHLPAPPNVLAYVACLPVFNNIKQCYREYQYTHPNIYGD